MAELRYNPLLDDWTMVSANRSNRPQMPKDYCPFDPGSGKVPDDYDVYEYDNDFPILSQNPSAPDKVGSELYRTASSYGKCEVILYSPSHTGKLHEQTHEHIKKLVDLWTNRTNFMKSDKNIKYVFVFENKGKEVGTTMPHPHGQIYGYSKMPLRMRIELENTKNYYEKTGKNMFDTMIEDERNFAQRMIFEDEYFSVFIPFFCEYPFGAYIVAKKNVGYFSDFDEEMKNSFANTLKTLTASFDLVYDRDFPYMMCVYQYPVNEEKYKGAGNYYRFHVKFFPPLRGKESIKYNASSETGAFAHGNPCKVEDTAKLLRQAVERYNNGK